MKKIINSLVAVCIMAVLFSACQSYDDVSIVLGADVNTAEVIAQRDTHGGFHGDGERFIVFAFEDDTFENAIKKDNTWHAFPVKENTIMALLYGMEIQGVTYGPYLQNEMPQIENGYYFFYDRHTESTEPFDSSEVLERSSLNFSVAVYDIETDQLYYAEMDT